MLEKVDEKDEYKRTGLLYASEYGSYDIIRMMYEQFQMNIEQKDKDDWTALLHVCRYSNNIDIIQLLLKYKANTEQ